jgi:radical SAM superfamily enzyme YgiQ (UPF0313 family)
VNILIIFPRLEELKSWHYVPYGALCVASKLLADGHIVKIHDERIKPLNLHHAAWANEIMVSAFTGFQLADAYRLITLIKKDYSYKKIILGGQHATLFPKQCLDDFYIDEIWTGYAERGECPIPWELVDVKDYVNPKTERAIYVSSYGCPGVCTFCATKKRSENIFIPLKKARQDIDNLMRLYPFKEMVFFDASLFTDPERAGFFATIMHQHGLKWICDSRADEIYRTSPYQLDRIVESGLKQITIGLESGSPAVIDRMKKGHKHLEVFERSAEILSRYDITMASGVIFGTPGETPKDIKQTIEYIKKIRDINPSFRISTTFYKPLPNTEMCEMAKAYGYTEPETLEGWAERGALGHFQYNAWDDVPWIEGKAEYKAIYDEFVAGNSGLFI